jgi:hypothetical protein
MTVSESTPDDHQHKNEDNPPVMRARGGCAEFSEPRVVVEGGSFDVQAQKQKNAASA